jgi:hypothetical protein
MNILITGLLATSLLLTGCSSDSSDEISGPDIQANKVSQAINEACGYWATSLNSGTGLMSSEAATKFGKLADIDSKYESESKAAYKLLIISESTKNGIRSESMAVEAREISATLLALCS